MPDPDPTLAPVPLEKTAGEPPPENPYKAGEPSPFSLGVDTQLEAPLRDLTTQPPQYWQDLDARYLLGEITTDDYYQIHRQRAQDEESPLLQADRASRAAQAPPAETPVQGPALEMAAPGPSTAEQTGNLLTTLGITGVVPLRPAGTLVEAFYGQDPGKDTNPVYRTLQRLATALDVALTAVNVPITGVGDIANLVMAPLTLGLQAAGADRETIAGFVKNTDLVAELAAAFGTGAGALGAAGQVGNLTGLGTELGALLKREGQLLKLADSFAGTMRNVWKSERGEIRVPGGEPPLTPEILQPDTVETLAQKYTAVVIAARRGGPRTLEQVAAEGQALIDQGLVSLDTIKMMKPGTALNDAETWAVVHVLADEGQRVMSLAEAVLLDPQPGRIAQLVEQFWTFSLALDPKRIGAEAEAGRATHIYNEPLSGKKQFLTQFEVQARNTTTGVDGLTLARAITSFEDPAKLATFAKQAQKPGFWDYFNEYYVNGLLWGPKTWEANFLGNTVSLLWSIPERQLAAVLGGGKGVQMGEAWELLHPILVNQLDAWRVAWQAFKTGESQVDLIPGMSKTELPRRQAISAHTLELTGTAGAAVDLLGHTIRVPGRVLQSTDDYFKALAWMGEMKAQALREAAHEAMAAGLTGPEFAAHVDQRIAQKMFDPPESIKLAADKHSLYVTYQTELGKAGRLFSKLSNLPGGKILLPILRTPLNMGKFVGERTPLMVFNRRLWREINGPDRAVADLAKAKVALGSFALAIAAMWWWNGTLTSAGPVDKKLRQDMYDNLGWRPYSVKIGSTYVGINRLEPPGVLLGMGADFAEAVWNAAQDPEDESWLDMAEESANAATVAIAKAFSNRTMVKGLAETFSAMADPERAGESRMASFLISTVPLSSLVRQTEMALDPTMREADGVIQRFRSQVPGLSATLKPHLNLQGDPVYMTGAWGPVSISTQVDDPVARERIKVGARIPSIPKAVGAKGARVALTATEQHYWTYQRGKMTVDGLTLHERQAQTMASEFYRTSEASVKAHLLERDIMMHQQRAWMETLKKYPNLDKAVREAIALRIERRRQGAQPEDDAMTPLLRSLTR